jgi:DNA excision repair protein ERCC-4
MNTKYELEEGDADVIPSFVVDDREKTAILLPFLLEYGIKVHKARLNAGDYLLNNTILIERKTADDFIQSLMSGRLFAQCRKLLLSNHRPLLLIEGNLFGTAHKIDENALKGAVLSIASAWNIPLIYANNAEESANLLHLLYNQGKAFTAIPRQTYHKPRRHKEKRIQFLQGLPNTGPVRAERLLTHFGSVEKTITADVKSLMAVEGIGKKAADKIREFLTS